MSLSNHPRRLAATAFALRPSNPQICHTCRHSLQIRHIALFDRIFRRKKAQKEPLPPILDPSSPEYLRQKPDAPPEMPKSGDLAPGSILEDEVKPPAGTTQPTPRTASTGGGANRDPRIMAAELDPVPMSRMRWERKMVIRSIKKRGRLSKTERIMQTERQSLSKSPWIGTSVKKLFPLANQIAGKPIQEAIVQMRFSKKKAARDVKTHLEYALNEAIVKRGMGLGGMADAEGTKGPEGMRIVEDKKGTKRVVKHPTEIYIDQAWISTSYYEHLCIA
ncbi:MAG: hypothetical protein Q9195_008499 [Heterodermia aff. obscurata]